MEQLTNVQLQTLEDQTLKDLPNAIYLPVLEDGATHLDWQVGTTLDLFGQEAARASHTQSPALQMAARKAKTMNDTYGQPSSASSKSVSLQRSLASRLEARLPGDGSTPF